MQHEKIPRPVPLETKEGQLICQVSIAMRST